MESEDGELYLLEITNGKKVFTKSRHDSSKSNTKGGGKVEPTKNVSAVDWSHQSRLQSQDPH